MRKGGPIPKPTALKLLRGVTRSAGNFAVAATVGAPSTDSETTSIWADPNCAGGQTAVVVTLSGSTGSIGVIVMEWSGLVASSVVDKTASQVTAGSSSWSSTATATTTQASEVAIGAVGAFNASGIGTITGPGGAWTNLTQVTSASTHLGLLTGWQVLSSTGTVTYSGSFAASSDYAALAVTFKASALIAAAGLATATAAASPPLMSAGLAVATATAALPAGGRVPVTALATGTAYTAGVSLTGPITVHPGAAAAVGAAYPPPPSVTALVGTRAGGYSSVPGLAVPGLFTPGSPGSAGVPGAAGAAYPPAISYMAGLATATSAAYPPLMSAGLAVATGAAYPPQLSVQLAAATGAAYPPLMDAGLAVATGAAYQPSTIITGLKTVFPGAAAATGAAQPPPGGVIGVTRTAAAAAAGRNSPFLIASPALTVSGFGTFPQVPAGSVILAVIANVAQYGSDAQIAAPVYELWDGTAARIGSPVVGTATTSTSNVDSVVFTGVTYGQLATLQLRIYAETQQGNSGATVSVDAAALAVEWSAAVVTAFPDVLAVPTVVPVQRAGAGVGISLSTLATTPVVQSPSVGQVDAAVFPAVRAAASAVRKVTITTWTSVTPGVLAVVPVLPPVSNVTAPGWSSAENVLAGGNGAWSAAGSVTGVPDGAVAIWTAP